jgi:hypothetical protein
MKRNISKLRARRWFLTTFLIFSACKQAGYQVLKPGALNQNEFDSSKTIPPTARVETLDRGVSVTWTYVGNRVEVRPSADTLDPDYIGKDQCQNPGIIAAEYDLGNNAKPKVSRTDCTSLASSGHVFSKAGTYVIKLAVKSKDNEIATASMTLKVVDRNAPASEIEGGFTIHARPILAQINQPIEFSGICELKGKLTIKWNYGDSATGAGAVTQHAYDREGQHLVTASCANDSGKTLEASLTVVVMGTTPPTIPTVPVPVPKDNPNIPRKPNCDPSQGPCQTTTQAPQGGKTIPNSTSRVWYYYPSCRCYVKQ